MRRQLLRRVSSLAFVPTLAIVLIACGSANDDGPKPTVTRDQTYPAPSFQPSAGGSVASTATTEVRSSAESPAETSTESVSNGADSAEIVALGEGYFSQFSCVACHSVTGGTGMGPALNGIYGTERPLADGSTVLVDEEYLRTAIIDPAAQSAEGFNGAVMAGAVSGFQAEFASKPEIVDAIIAFIQNQP
jgi:cytochrome c oxidase subunit 2